MEYKPGRELFIADAWWLPPDTDPIGPMSLDVKCSMDGPACRLHVRQGGFENSPRWQRYYSIISRGWRTSLVALKAQRPRAKRSCSSVRRNDTRCDGPSAS